jgi:hypothetical protein
MLLFNYSIPESEVVLKPDVAEAGSEVGAKCFGRSADWLFSKAIPRDGKGWFSSTKQLR